MTKELKKMIEDGYKQLDKRFNPKEIKMNRDIAEILAKQDLQTLELVEKLTDCLEIAIDRLNVLTARVEYLERPAEKPACATEKTDGDTAVTER